MKKNLFVLAALTAALVPALASAETAELRVIGTIVPGACAPVFTGGGVVDHNIIFASTLNAATGTTLPEKTVGLTVTCDAPTRVGIKVTDERAASVVPGLPTLPNWSLDSAKYGLGASAGRNIGAYSLHSAGGIADGAAVDNIVTSDGGTTWLRSGAYTAAPANMYSFAAAGSLVPGAFTTMTTNIRVGTAIDAAQNLDLTNDVPLDGLATFEISYL